MHSLLSFFPLFPIFGILFHGAGLFGTASLTYKHLRPGISGTLYNQTQRFFIKIPVLTFNHNDTIDSTCTSFPSSDLARELGHGAFWIMMRITLTPCVNGNSPLLGTSQIFGVVVPSCVRIVCTVPVCLHAMEASLFEPFGSWCWRIIPSTSSRLQLWGWEFTPR